MNDAELLAVQDTASATWALVYATFILAVLTLLLFAAAVSVPAWQRRLEFIDRAKRRAALDKWTAEAIENLRAHVAAVAHEYETENPLSLDVNGALNQLMVNRRVIKSYIKGDFAEASMRYRVMLALQLSFEAYDHIEGVKPGRGMGKSSKEAAGALRKSLTQFDAAIVAVIASDEAKE